MDLATVTEIAREFGVDRTTVYRWIRDHSLPTYKKIGDRHTYADRKRLRPFLALHPKTKIDRIPLAERKSLKRPRRPLRSS